MSATIPTETMRLAHFALSLTPSQVPTNVTSLAKRHFLDALGIAIASTGFDFAKVARNGVLELGSGEAASAIGSATRMPAASAALLNGVLAHGLDYDDTHIAGVFHASAPALATALAAGQASRSTGRDTLMAFIAGIEIGCRVAAAGEGEFTRRGFHPTAVCATYATTAVAGRLMGSAEPELVHAMGLAGSMAAGMLEMGESWLKRLHPGWAAHSGIVATALGKAGFLGPSTSIEGGRGFYATHIGQVPNSSALPSQRLGEQWQALQLALKPYPCCHIIHAYVDAAFAIRGKCQVEEIERIECPLIVDWHRLIAEPRDACVRPANSYRALFSMQYVVALAIVRGKVGLEDFYDRPLDDDRVVALAERIAVVDDPLSDYPVHFPGELIVHLRNGEVLRKRSPVSFGTPELPMRQSDVEEKFFANATRCISFDAATRIRDMVADIEALDSLEPLLRLTAAEPL